MENPKHLGNGIWAYHDGEGVEIARGEERSHPIYLAPEVLRELLVFAQRMYEAQTITKKGNGK